VAGVKLPDMRPWGRGPLTIPPRSREDWIQLAIWEVWMGMLVSVILGLGALLVAASSGRIVVVPDLTNCYGPPPVALPCEQLVYRGGALDAAFTALCGLMLIGTAAWYLWELWSATEPKPVTDDFLRLLHESFARDWRRPRTWPWTRVLWAYGFASLGAMVTLTVGLTAWMFVASSRASKPSTIRVDTSQSFRLER
jgi:hypothetical protein